MSAKRCAIELWCDSFHEGVWAAEGIATKWPKQTIRRTWLLDFIPQYEIDLSNGTTLILTVFGGYGNWEQVPKKVSDLLAWGKPDIIAYHREEDKLLFAVEETAAVPTGNQALQRCERMHGASALQVPFWYLLSQYGIHADEGVRQASPWPALMAVALTATFRIPNLVLLYSSTNSPEDYSAGIGMDQLFNALSQLLNSHAQGGRTIGHLAEELSNQYRSMLQFVAATYMNVTDFIPGSSKLLSDETANLLGQIATGTSEAEARLPLLEWPLFAKLPAEVKTNQKASDLIKKDKFLQLIERGRGEGWCYSLSSNAGSRPQPRQSVQEWIDGQNRLHTHATRVNPPAEIFLDIGDFPESSSGLLHVTTAKNVLYLIDNSLQLIDAFVKAHPRLEGKAVDFSEKPAMLYVSNSLKPGRIFGDPYTGQFAAFSWIFGGTQINPRVKCAYFPHHTHGVLRPSRSTSNKGQQLFCDRADFLLFGSGVIYNVKEGVFI